ncbi:MAG: YchJ family protein [Colwellia sp.]
MNNLNAVDNNICPCGSALLFKLCCNPFIQGEKQAKTPEQLMRSRYSAYAINNAQYIYDTYAKASQKSQSVAEIKAWADECVWLALEIVHSADVVDNYAAEPYAYVEFSAYYLLGSQLNKLHEKSRFVLQQSNVHPEKQWRYLDGDVTEHTELANIKRNDPCPCNHYKTSFSALSPLSTKKNKKFKHCCGQ